MNKIISLLIFYSLVSADLRAQIMIPDAEDFYSDIKEYMLAGDYREALALLISLGEKGYNSSNISYLTGECYLNIAGQKTKAIPYLKEASENISAGWKGINLSEKTAPGKTWLYLGIAYRLNNDFNNAISCFNSYIQTLDDTDTHNKAMAEYHIMRCRNAIDLIKAPAQFNSDTINIRTNNDMSNFNPVLTAKENEVFFMNEYKFYDAVMHSTRNANSWSEAINLIPELKSDGDHYLTGSSATGNELFFFYYDPYLSGEIYFSEKINGIWTKVTALGENINTQFNETHASVSPDGQYLYFTSDRPGGYGGLDIYRSKRLSSSEWGIPENLGPLVNSPYNEESPFVSGDGSKLFFSSQGHFNMGGYDVFYAAFDTNDHFLPPVNIGYPINTTDDNVFLFPVGDGRVAYQARYAFNGQQNIVRFTIKSFGNPYRFVLNGRVNVVSDNPDFHPEDISVAFIEKSINDTLGLNRLDKEGSFTQKLPSGNYRIDFASNDEILLTKDLDIPEYLPQESLVINERITIKEMLTADTLYLRAIRFGFDNISISNADEGYLKEVADLMLKYPGINVSVYGYTDALGSETYNRKLSEKRAVTVLAVLNKYAGLRNRVTSEGMGENNPVAINTNPDGSDSAAGRSFNRRVELVLENTPQQLIIIRQSDIPVQLIYE